MQLRKKRWKNFAGSWTNMKGNSDDSAPALDFSRGAAMARPFLTSFPVAGSGAGSAGYFAHGTLQESIEPLRSWRAVPCCDARSAACNLHCPFATRGTITKSHAHNHYGQCKGC